MFATWYKYRKLVSEKSCQHSVQTVERRNFVAWPMYQFIPLDASSIKTGMLARDGVNIFFIRRLFVRAARTCVCATRRVGEEKIFRGRERVTTLRRIHLTINRWLGEQKSPPAKRPIKCRITSFRPCNSFQETAQRKLFSRVNRQLRSR